MANDNNDVGHLRMTDILTRLAMALDPMDRDDGPSKFRENSKAAYFTQLLINTPSPGTYQLKGRDENGRIHFDTIYESIAFDLALLRNPGMSLLEQYGAASEEKNDAEARAAITATRNWLENNMQLTLMAVSRYVGKKKTVVITLDPDYVINDDGHTAGEIWVGNEKLRASTYVIHKYKNLKNVEKDRVEQLIREALENGLDLAKDAYDQRPRKNVGDGE